MKKDMQFLKAEIAEIKSQQNWQTTVSSATSNRIKLFPDVDPTSIGPGPPEPPSAPWSFFPPTMSSMPDPLSSRTLIEPHHPTMPVPEKSFHMDNTS